MNQFFRIIGRVLQFCFGTARRSLITLIIIIVLATVQQFRPGIVQNAAHGLWQEVGPILHSFAVMGIMLIGIGIMLRGLFGKKGKK